MSLKQSGPGMTVNYYRIKRTPYPLKPLWAKDYTPERSISPKKLEEIIESIETEMSAYFLNGRIIGSNKNLNRKLDKKSLTKYFKHNEPFPKKSEINDKQLVKN